MSDVIEDRRLMQAVWLDRALSWRSDVLRPLPAVGEALIRVRLAGICATDLELRKGYAGFCGIPGHEFVGEVVDVADPAQSDWLERRVVGDINLACGCCDACRRNLSKHCRQRQVLGIRHKSGVFAQYCTLPVSNLQSVPDTVRDTQAVFAEPLAAALAVQAHLPSPEGCEPVAVLGAGRLGLLIAATLRLAGYSVVVLGRSQASRLLPQRWGLTVLDSTAQPEQSFSWLVDASGCAEGLRQALRCLRPQGTLILKSTYAEPEPLDLQRVVVAELRLIGSRCGSLAQAVALLAQQVLPVEELIEACYRLDEAELAFQHAAQPGVKKIVFRPD